MLFVSFGSLPYSQPMGTGCGSEALAEWMLPSNREELAFYAQKALEEMKSKALKMLDLREGISASELRHEYRRFRQTDTLKAFFWAETRG